MTCIVTTLVPGAASCAVDTRVTSWWATGEREGFTDGASKLHRLPGAWLACGKSVTLAGWVAETVLAGGPVTEATRDRLQQITPHPPTYGAFLTQWDPDGPASYFIDLRERVLSRQVKIGVDSSSPWTGTTRHAVDAAKDAWCSEVMATFRSRHMNERPGLWETVRRIGRLYVEIGHICGPDGTISSDVHLGLLLPDQAELGPVPAAQVASATEAELEAAVQERVS
jgi:hypothetical protein